VISVHEAVGSDFRVLSDAELDDVRTQAELPEGPILFHVGNTQPRKNLEGLIRALSLLHLSGLDATLVQAGGTLTREQWELVESFRLERHVLLLGRVSEPALVGLYNLADVLVFPSFHEGFGFPILEAMACGTPVVAADAASLPEVAGDAGLLVDPHSPEEICEATADVLTDAALAAELRHRGLARVRQFTWSKTAEQTAAVYGSLVDTGR
jgi:glycosyltransferase involved in cell wall biosynthesis